MKPLSVPRARSWLAVAAVALLATSATAQKKKDEGGEDPFGDLFGDSLGGEKVDLKDLTKDVKKNKKDRGLKAKQAVIKDKDIIKLERVFAAARIKMDKRRGCVPADRDRTKVRVITVDAVPVLSPKFAVCLTISADAGRAVRMTTSVVSPKNRRIARSESTVDFRSKPLLDHIMDFPPVELRQTGQYFYLVEIDGKEAGRLPLFEVVKEQAVEPAEPSVTIDEG